MSTKVVVDIAAVKGWTSTMLTVTLTVNASSVANCGDFHSPMAQSFAV